MRAASRRRSPCDPGDTEDDPGATGELTPADALVKNACRQDEKKDDSEREDRLDDRQWRQRQREQLQWPAGDREGDRAEPETSPGKAREQRDLNGSIELDSPSLECLQRIRNLVACGRATCRKHSEGYSRCHRCDDGPVRAQVACTIGAVGAAVWSAPAPAPIVPAVANALGIPRRLERACGVALTFDDGPHAEGTPAVLEALDRAGAAATFFLVGEQVERRPTLAAEIASAGHEVAVHGYSHRLHLLRTPQALRDDLERALATIEDAIAAETKYYRPPYGVFSRASLDIVRRSGRRPLLWSRWGRDWRRSATPKGIADKATAGLGPGDVVLLHDADYYSSEGSWRRTVAALPEVVDRVAELGEPLVSVTQST